MWGEGEVGGCRWCKGEVGGSGGVRERWEGQVVYEGVSMPSAVGGEG